MDTINTFNIYHLAKMTKLNLNIPSMQKIELYSKIVIQNNCCTKYSIMYSKLVVQKVFLFYKPVEHKKNCFILHISEVVQEMYNLSTLKCL